MTNDKNDVPATDERLAEAQAQVESLQSAAADAEARAATAAAELKTLKREHSAVRAQLSDAEAAREAVEGELAQTRSELSDTRSRLREAAGKYREARLSASPEVPHDLVPPLESLEEIDREFEAAQRIVGQLREKMEREAREQSQSARVPLGAPARRAPDLSSLSTSDKIKLGLQQALGARRKLTAR
jgi:chromosome segregation ATPase